MNERNKAFGGVSEDPNLNKRRPDICSVCRPLIICKEKKVGRIIFLRDTVVDIAESIEDCPIRINDERK